jgi:hypothetical protein
MVSLPRNQFIALVLGVCVLSAGIGSGLALLAQEGSAGPAGKPGAAGPQGPEGAEGPEGPSGAAEVGGLEAEVAGIEGVTSELCEELELFC